MKKIFYSFIFLVLINLSEKAQWVQMSNGMGNDKIVRAFVVSGNNIFAGTYANGVYLSTNNGSTWSQTALNNIAILSFAISGNNIFAGGNGTYLSTNNGQNWTQTSGLQVNCLAISGINIFAGTPGNGVYLSTNNGQNWTQTASGTGYVNSLAISGNNIFAGTNDYGVYLSTNNGNTWTQTALNNRSILSLVISGNNIFAGVVNGGSVYLSTNNGTNWTQTALNTSWVWSFALSGNNIFAGSASGVYLSTNNGVNWFQKNQGFVNNQYIYSLLITNNFIFAGTNGQSVWRFDLSISSSPPTLISPVNNSIDNHPNLNLKWNKSLSAIAYNVVLATDPAFANIVLDSVLTDTTKALTNLSTGTYYYWKVRSMNISEWGPFSSFFTFKTVSLIPPVLISPANNSTGNPLNLTLTWNKCLYAIAYNVVLATDASFTNIVFDSELTDTTKAVTNLNGNTQYYWKVRSKIISEWSSYSSYFNFRTSSPWEQIHNGMGSNYSVKTFTTLGNYIFAGTTSNGVYKSTNNGINWTSVNSGLTNQNVLSLTTNNNNLYAGTSGGGIYQSTNNGDYWVAVSNGLGNNTVNALLSKGTSIYSGTLFGVYLTTNNGGMWVQSGLLNEDVRTLYLNGSTILAGTHGGGVFQSTNNGISWTSRNSGLGNLNVLSIVVNGVNLFAGTEAGVFLSTNNGLNWTAGWLTNQVIYSLAESNNRIFIGSNVGSLVSFDNGLSWININIGFVSVNSVYSYLIYNDYIFAGTDNSVWRRILSQIIGIKQTSEVVPSSFSLSQNYPNPFNPSTFIKFDVSKNSFVTLKIFDVLGREVTVLVNEQLKPGTYQTDWNASSYPSGVYFYRLRTEKFTETKRMVLIK